MKSVWQCRVGSGKFKVLHREDMDKTISILPDGDYLLTIEDFKTKRTLKQNNYMHALFTIFSKEVINHTGDLIYTPEYIKSMAKRKLLYVEDYDKNGEVCERVKDTHELNTQEMVQFIDGLVQWAAERFDIVLPLPKTQQNLFE
jgi:hypothetical protein